MLFDFVFQTMALCEEVAEFSGESFHLLFEGYAVVFRLGDAYIPARGEDIVLFGDFFDGLHGAETFLVFQNVTLVGTESGCRTLRLGVLPTACLLF